MRRYLPLTAGPVFLALALTMYAVPGANTSIAANGDPIPDAATPMQPADNSGQKRLHTVPEDGMAIEEPVPPKAVRDILAARPNEDLIICLAGCTPRRDIVIYAQPAEARPSKPVADAASPAPAIAQPVAMGNQPSSDNADKSAKPSVINAAADLRPSVTMPADHSQN